MPDDFRIGTAGWSIPKQHAAAFPGAGNHLKRYAKTLPAVEINSSFYRPHRNATYARWAASVPPGFRFAVKVPREITHQRRLTEAVEPLDRFLGEASALGDRLGPLLVQLPPSLRYDEASVGALLALLRARFEGDVACEPHHATWFTARVDAALSRFRVARVAADPAPARNAGVPGGWPGLVYRRLHGSPKMYYSAYAPETLDAVAQAMRGELADGRASWCIRDNTALGEPTTDALGLLARLRAPASTKA